MSINQETLRNLIKDPFIQKLIDARPVFWANPGKKEGMVLQAAEWESQIAEADKRLRRFAPYIAEAFPETKAAEGMIESPLFEIRHMKKKLEEVYGETFPGRWLLKCDHELPISGSIKARGGIYEVLKHAEELALQEGRRQAEQDPFCYFIDDEHSRQLFLGYAVAASRLKTQLSFMDIEPGPETPLFVYLPCGVGGGPGGVAFGLKLLYGNHVHVFFGEPTHSPSMLLGLYSGLHDQISVQDIGLDNVTAADGLAVGRPSGFVGNLIEPLLSGCYTIEDETLYTLLHLLALSENKHLEPSALAGMFGPVQLFLSETGKYDMSENDLRHSMKNAVHVVWGTGGSMVPKEEMAAYNRIGADLLIR
ncbi:D-serine ammonia-lyase [Bacillus halotolerans]|uniref:D-serine ammonia-lyase n=1 Tax=Bacillus halotolerans TaxID=260554 RepID=UPI002DBBD35E|nr:D-serine ammonia-lyase [Bacillus halotolerans]MEC1661893.1 D-serine ammonia-lyase [Bacillus halotolerans]